MDDDGVLSMRWRPEDCPVYYQLLREWPWETTLPLRPVPAAPSRARPYVLRRPGS